MVGSYGNIKFVVSGDKAEIFNGLNIQKKARYIEHSRINAKPLLQFMGEDLTIINFEMNLYSFLGVNPRKELEKLEKHMKKGDANKFIVGSKNFGSYVVENLSQSVVLVDGKGLMQGIQVSVTLKEYIR